MLVAGDRTPLDDYLEDQSRLSAVERFCARHDAGPVGRTERYRDLLPATAPRPGQQYAFEVDLDACSGCKACVAACHSLNGLDDGEAFRTVGLLRGDDGGVAVQQTVTTACHHCVDPACLAGCPAKAYDKDPVTGIVTHLDDQCIGCGYCTLTCPYEVPTMNRRLGIVRKCDLCKDRLAAGEAPACAQACPTSAIRVGLVEIASVARTGSLVPAAPPSATTRPATVFRRRAPLPAGLLPADHAGVRPAAGHPPLVVMLVVTQLAVGTLLGGLATGVPAGRWIALAAGAAALVASVLHLGRPTQAWRAVLGLRRSWLSREVVAFGAFASLTTVAAASGSTALALAAAATGVAGVACSALVYSVTGRTWWSLSRTAARFAATTAACGLAVTLLLLVLAGGGPVGPTAVALAAVAVAVLATELAFPFRHRAEGTGADLGRTAVLLTRDLRSRRSWRLGLLAAGGLVMPSVLLVWGDPAGGGAVAVTALGLAAVVAGELAERSVFFAAASGPRMPGGLA